NFLSALVIFGLFQLDCQILAQSPKEITNSIGMKLVLIPKGTFMMGSPKTEEGRQENESLHEVTMSKEYYLGAFEVTQTQYQTVTGNNPSCYQGALVGNQNADLPVENVSWEWCSNWYGEYSTDLVSDPTGPTMGTDRVNRGGCWLYQAASCRSASRNWAKPSYRDGLLGFRVALSPSEIPKSPEAGDGEASR
ncbi:MAG: formylglycine-generating enzyme family protein, partial [Pirellula sp.]